MSSRGEQSAFANINASTTDGSVVAAAAGSRIVVTSVVLLAGGTATDLTFNTKPAGTGSAISPLFAQGVRSPVLLPYNPSGWFRTNAGEGLSVTTAAGSASGVLVTYRLDPA